MVWGSLVVIEGCVERPVREGAIMWSEGAVVWRLQRPVKVTVEDSREERKDHVEDRRNKCLW